MDITIKEIKKQTICLNMIVKNEAHVICETFDNLLKYFVFDYYVICDTGSTDGTQQKIKEYFNNKNIKGEIHECEWKDFGHNRSEALEKAYNKTDYLLIFDADDKMHGDFKLPNELNRDMYHLQFGDNGGSFVYKRPLLINNRKRFSYKGVLHEFLAPQEKNISQGMISGNYGVESGKTGNRSKDPDKYKKDAIILEKAYHSETDKGLKNRYAFYCAQSFKDSNNKDKAIEWYKKTLELDSWHQEKYYAALTIGYLYNDKNEKEKAIHYWLKTMEYDMERIEGVVMACEEYRNRKMNNMIITLYEKFKDYKKINNNNLCEKLFLDKSRYDDRLELLASIAAGYSVKPHVGFDACVEIIINQSKKKPINQGLINAVLFNLNFYTKFYNDKRELEFFYALDLVYSKMDNIKKIHVDAWEFVYSKVSHLLTEKKELRHTPVNKDKPWIIITFTTCKRLDLFKQTINSILNHWEDYEKIDYWFCVDDNSSDEDREKMRELCPWMEFNMKTHAEKGHRESMNIIWEKLNTLKPKYWIHMEDDFVFHKKMPYIKKGIEGLDKFKSKNIKQVLFNRNYAERIDGYRIKGHEKLDDEFSMHKHNNEKTNYINSHYWPHYSFRPSIIDVETILSLGNYDSENQFFEMDYANKWNKHNYKSAFFDFITNRHIGRLTSERNDKNKPNAYQLNEESQFTKDKNSHIKIVNLKRRKDRKEEMIKKLQEQNIKNYEFIEAVDGDQLKATKQINELFKGNDFEYRRGVIGCALSHYNLWIKLINDKKTDYYIIFEDDIEFTDNFNKIFTELEKSASFSTSECIMLGYSMTNEDRKQLNINKNNNEINIEKINKDFYKGGTFAYSINKQGAKKIVDYISKNNIRHGIDTVMSKVDTLVMGELNPQLVGSTWVRGDGGDSDIISNGPFTRLIYKDLTDEFVFIKGVDHHGDDCYYNNNFSIQEMMEHAYYSDECVGFNTLGFFKNTVELLKPSHFFSDTDGMYVKKSIVDGLQSQIKEIEETHKRF